MYQPHTRQKEVKSSFGLRQPHPTFAPARYANLGGEAQPGEMDRPLPTSPEEGALQRTQLAEASCERCAVALRMLSQVQLSRDLLKGGRPGHIGLFLCSVFLL